MIAEPTTVEKLTTELDPESRTHWLWRDPSPEAIQAWIETYLTVVDVQEQIVDFKLFPQQVKMLHNITGRDITVKGRQTRASTLLLARRVRRVASSHGLKCLVAANDDQTTGMFRNTIKRWFRDLARHGFEFKFDGDNDNELILEGMESQFIYQSGQQKIIGRSFTAHDAHISELAHWPPQKAAELLGGLEQAVPGPPYGLIDYESTPKGAEGVFYEGVQAAKPYDLDSLWSVHFYPWWMEPRYRVAVATDMDADIRLPQDDLDRRLAAFRPSTEEEHLMAQFQLDPLRMLWRRFKIKSMAKTGVPFQQEYPETLDGCFLGTSGNYFMALDGVDHLGYYRNLCQEPITQTEALQYNGVPIKFQGANLAIWEFPNPENTYVAWMDCASGETGSQTDFMALVVLNVQTKTVAARLRMKVTPAESGRMACAVGQYYNTALFGVERDSHGATALQVMREMEYPNLYYHIDPANPTAPVKLGIYPTEQARDAILQALRNSVFDHSFVTRDSVMVGEMSTFDWVKVQNRKKAMSRGKVAHDDLVMAVAGAVYILPRALELRRHSNRRRGEEIVVGQFGQVLSRRDLSRRRQPWLR